MWLLFWIITSKPSFAPATFTQKIGYYKSQKACIAEGEKMLRSMEDAAKIMEQYNYYDFRCEAVIK